MRKVPIAQINQSAIQVLYKEIGVVNTMRFLNQFSNGQGNYTEERDQIWGGMSVDEIAAEIGKECQDEQNANSQE